MGPPPHAACAACKFQRRKCAADCPLAPWFPPDQPKRFANVHKLFGVANVLKLFKENAGRLRDLVKSIVYEADARERDPVNGAYGILQLLQREANTLELRRAKLQDTLDKMLQTEAQETAKQYLPSTTPQQLLNMGESSNLSSYINFPGTGVYWGTQQQIGVASGYSKQPEQNFVQYNSISPNPALLTPEQGYFYTGSMLQHPQHSQMQASGYPQLLQAQCALKGNGFSYHSVNGNGLEEAMPQSNSVRGTMMVPVKNININSENPQYMRDFLSLRNNNHSRFP